MSEAGKRTFGIRKHVVVGEVDFALLFQHATVTAIHQDLSPYPAVTRDFNFIVDNRVHWADLQTSVTEAASSASENVTLELVEYKETFRDEQRDGSDRKRLLLSVVLRSSNDTFTVTNM